LTKNQKRILNQIKDKVNNNNAVISKSDKGNSVVIICQNTYHEKVMNFIHNNKFANITGDVTKKFQKALRKNIIECPHIKKTLFKLIKYKIVVFEEVYILFHFNIILKHNGMSSTKIIQ